MKFSVYAKGKRADSAIGIRALQDDQELGLFESLRTYPGDAIFREKEHLVRFQESAKTAGLWGVPESSVLSRELRSALQAFHREHPGLSKSSEFFLRLCFWQGKVLVMVGERKHPKEIYEKGVQLTTSPVRRTMTNAQSAQVKTSAYHNAFMASLEVKPSATYEWIFLDREGYVTESRIGNIFVVKREELLTPPEDGILNGVTRSVVIECALRNRLRVTERPLTRHEIFNADEAFLTNTSWQILPVSRLDGRQIGSSVPGPVIIRLQQTFAEIVREECP